MNIEQLVVHWVLESDDVDSSPTIQFFRQSSRLSFLIEQITLKMKDDAYDASKIKPKNVEVNNNDYESIILCSLHK